METEHQRLANRVCFRDEEQKLFAVADLPKPVLVSALTQASDLARQYKADLEYVTDCSEEHRLNSLHHIHRSERLESELKEAKKEIRKLRKELKLAIEGGAENV